MKQVIFVVESLNCGGAERSLISLLKALNPNIQELNITILVLIEDSDLLYDLPNNISIKKLNLEVSIHQRITFRLYRLFNISKNHHNAQLFWKSIESSLPSFDETFDTAIAWGQGFATYFTATKIKAVHRYAWVNTDYLKAGYNPKKDHRIYSEFDKIIAISNHVKNIMTSCFPNLKVATISNIIDETEITLKAKEKVEFHTDPDSMTILTIGRLAKVKAFDKAIKAIKYLSDQNFKVQLFIIGKGSEYKYLDSLIKKLNLESKCILLGYKENPYPYLAKCNIYLQTSEFEGLGRTLIEAVILKKPIVTTSFPTAHEILERSHNSLITGSKPKEIAKAIISLSQSKDLDSYCIEKNTSFKSYKENIVNEFVELVNTH